MGDYVDGRGAVMPAPGNGRPKRMRIDREGNAVSEGDVQWYSAVGQKFSLNAQLSDYEVVTTTPVALSVAVPISILDGTANNVISSLPVGTYIGQRKFICCSRDGGNTVSVSGTNILGVTTTITLATAECVSLVWISDGTASGWVVVGTSTGSGGTPLAPAYA